MRTISEAGRSTHPHSILFSYPELATQNTSFISDWFDALEQLRPVLSMFLGPLSQRTMFVEFQFLSSMQALEGFHRRYVGGAYMLETEYASLFQGLVGAIPHDISQDFRRSLKAKLKWGYEYSQRKRLRGLLESLAAETQHAITGGFPGFVNKVVDERNRLVHNTDVGRLDFRELHEVSERLRSWVLILLLKQLGLPEELVVERIRRHPRWRSRVADLPTT